MEDDILALILFWSLGLLHILTYLTTCSRSAAVGVYNTFISWYCQVSTISITYKIELNI